MAVSLHCDGGLVTTISRPGLCVPLRVGLFGRPGLVSHCPLNCLAAKGTRNQRVYRFLATAIERSSSSSSRQKYNNKLPLHVTLSMRNIARLRWLALRKRDQGPSLFSAVKNHYCLCELAAVLSYLDAEREREREREREQRARQRERERERERLKDTHTHTHMACEQT